MNKQLTSPTNFKFSPSHIIRIPAFNKGTGFTAEERKKYKLHGLLPPRIETIEEQSKRAVAQLRAFQTPFEKYIYLMSLQGRNETLFYRVLVDNLVETMPIVYTPTVGEACQKFQQLWRFAQGMYFSLSDKGHIAEMLDNWDVAPDIIVVSDGSRILGLGDLGANGMGIPIGKLSLYVAGAGFHPHKTLPVILDVGTDNEQLLKDEYYLGNRHKRVRGKEFFDFADEWIRAVQKKWPHCLIQFEDFSNDVCFDLLEKYRNDVFCFNDDIQGTGAVICGGFLNAVKITKIPLMEHRIVFMGAGSASVGVANMIASVMMETGASKEEVAKRFYLIDTKGLVSTTRGDKLAPHKEFFARTDLKPNEQKKTLLEVIKFAKPTALIGLAGVGGVFTEEVVKEMCKYSERPVIFALSNPTSKAECTAEQAYKWTDGKCVYASGSPFEPVEYKGKIYTPGQGNNMYIFPGLGLGSVVAKAKRVSDGMILTAAKALSAITTQEELDNGQLYPKLTKIREISAKIAKAVAEQAVKENLCQLDPIPTDWEKEITNFVWEPTY